MCEYDVDVESTERGGPSVCRGRLVRLAMMGATGVDSWRVSLVSYYSGAFRGVLICRMNHYWPAVGWIWVFFWSGFPFRCGRCTVVCSGGEGSMMLVFLCL